MLGQSYKLEKNTDKNYMFYSGWMGGESYISMNEMRAKKPEFIIEHAVKGMLPRNKLGRQMIKKLKYNVFRILALTL